MARKITIILPDSLEPMLAEAARNTGRSLEEEAAELLRQRLEMPPMIPDDPDELERELLKGLEGPAREITREEWDRKTVDLSERHRRGQTG